MPINVRFDGNQTDEMEIGSCDPGPAAEMTADPERSCN
jgi:hypothetical protein